MKILLRNILVLFFFFFSGLSYACYSRDGSSAANLNFDFGNIVVPTDDVLPPGGIITYKDGLLSSMGAGLHQFTCGSPGDGPMDVNVNITGDGTLTPNVTYATNVPGVGLKFYYYSASEYGQEPTTPTQVATSFVAHIGDAYHLTYGGNPNASLRIELIKTASIHESVSGELTFSRGNFIDAGGYSLLNVNLTGNVIVPSCSLDPSTKTTIDLGSTSKTHLPDIGSTSNTHDFDIVLKCTASPNVSLNISGNESTEAPGQGVLALDPGSTAAGLGVRILYKNTPIIFNSELSVGIATEGQFIVPMRAQFYKTQNTLTAGELSSSMTFTLTYG